MYLGIPVSLRPSPRLWLVMATLTLLVSVPSIGAQSFPSPLQAESPRVYFPVEPCRAVDTRLASGGSGPLPAGVATDVYVRGASLPASQGGASNCNVPAAATGVVVNIAVINPSATGHLRANRTGAVTNSNSPYSRINYSPSENVSNEMVIELCNVNNYPAEHVPCPGPEPFIYADFQILNSSLPGTSVDFVVDVIGYTGRMPLTSAVSGDVITITEVTPTVRLFLLSNGLRVLCGPLYSDPVLCEEVQVGFSIRGAGHVINDGGEISVWAHGPIGIDQH